MLNNVNEGEKIGIEGDAYDVRWWIGLERQTQRGLLTLARLCRRTQPDDPVHGGGADDCLLQAGRAEARGAGDFGRRSLGTNAFRPCRPALV